jgi:D-3-phosphoglycerate dehydrogenase
VTAALIENCTTVRLIQKYGVGIDKIDVEAARRAGIPVAIAAGANAAPVSELALALMIAVNRRMAFADRETRAGRWPRNVMRSSCFQLDGKTVGLLGFGAIARQTARRLAGFDVDVLYHSRQRADRATEDSLRARAVSLDELLAGSDILSLHVPLTPATRHLIDAAALRKMKPGAILINTARGAVVDETALYEALASGQLRGAGLDVYSTEPPRPDHPLFRLDNVVVMPHAGGGVFDNVPRVMGHAFDNMRRLLAGQALPAADVVVAPTAKAAAAR